jgi:hypothetical protein
VIEEILTIDPLRCALMIRAASRQQRKVPVRLTLTTRFHSSSVVSATGRASPTAGVVHEDVEPAKALSKRSKERAHIVFARDIRAPGKLALRLEIAYRDRGALVAERLCDRASDAASSAGDERNLVCEPHMESLGRSALA